MTDQPTTDPGQYDDAIGTAASLARTCAELTKRLAAANAASARVVALLDRADAGGNRYVPVSAVQHALDGDDQ